MTSEFEPAEEPKDWTKLIWLSVGVLFAGMIAALWLSGKVSSEGTWIRVSHILIMFDRGDPAEAERAHETITSLRERILNGGSFKKLATEYSDDPGSAARGGYLGQSQRDAYVKEFEDYIWYAPIGELSDVILSDHGFHLIIVHDRHLSEADRYEMELDRRMREEAEAEKTQQ